MKSLLLSRRDLDFLLYEWLKVDELTSRKRFAEHSRETFDGVLDLSEQLAERYFAPHNKKSDANEPTFDGQTVTMVPEVKEAWDAFVEADLIGMSMDESVGGAQLPAVVAQAAFAWIAAANVSTSGYLMLTIANANLLTKFGTPEQIETYVKPMLAGHFSGTMALSETQAGSSLADVATRAEPRDDGTYRLFGSKMWISGAEHEITDNIVNLVLAKIPGGPPGTKGISLFIVPKFLVDEDGALGERNTLSCGSIEHKMGIHANATCVMNYDGAKGWMVGEENKGLAAMFVMMNAARLGVGIQGLGQADIAFQNAVQYAQDRRQGRALTGPQDPQEKADPLFVHPDVRRMLMDGKAVVEGLRALCLWGALQVDLSHAAESEAERQQADDLISLLTPVIKGYGTDKGFDVAVNAQQVFGGHGYIEEQGMSQYVRDARITMIYEGANGVQAMDLVGRKLAQNGGRAVQAFFGIVDAECAAAKDGPLADLAGRLEKANGELKAATMWFMQNGMANPNNVGAGAHHYMHIMGIVALGLMWLRIAEAAQKALDEGRGDTTFLEAKLVTARHFGERFIPDAGALRRKIEAGSEAMMALTPEQFVGA